ncbi:MAG: hypothetical protein IJV56_03580 [Neisseriaceae bacterium]|nr:hypothetical protein [Neisseriaceae bacterium]
MQLVAHAFESTFRLPEKSSNPKKPHKMERFLFSNCLKCFPHYHFWIGSFFIARRLCSQRSQ